MSSDKFSILAILACLTIPFAYADDGLIKLPDSTSSGNAIAFSVVQFTSAYKMYAYPQSGDYAHSSYFIQGFHTLDACMSAPRREGSNGGTIYTCDWGPTTVRDNLIPADVARSCIIPALRQLSVQMKSKSYSAPKVLFRVSYNNPEMPQTRDERDALVATLATNDPETLEMHMFLLNANTCEAHGFTKMYRYYGGVAQKPEQLQLQINRLMDKF